MTPKPTARGRARRKITESSRTVREDLIANPCRHLIPKSQTCTERVASTDATSADIITKPGTHGFFDFTNALADCRNA